MKKQIKFKLTAATYFNIAEQKYDDGDLEGAAHYFFKAYQKNGDQSALIALGEVYCEMGELEEGLKYLFLALDRDPDDGELCHSIAHCMMDLGDEETAFFYFQPRMTIKRFKYIMEETEKVENKYKPSIRILERSDEMVVGIAVKLLGSGDVVYARELLLTVRPDSDYYLSACNLLSLSYLEEEKPDEALKFAEKALSAKENIDSCCNLMLSYFLKNDTEKVEKMVEHIQGLKLDLAGHKTASLAFIRMDDAERAAGHLKVLLESSPYNRDALVSYALALYNMGETEKAKQLIITAARIYPADITVRETAKAFARGDKLDLFPLLNKAISSSWLEEIDEKLTKICETGKDLFEGDDFKDKISWLFQNRLTARQSRAALILCKFKGWQKFFREKLLDNEMDLASKKVCLFALLLAGKADTLGIVIDGMYARLKVRYPLGMDEVFTSAYCSAFSTFAFSDSCFEDRLHSTAKKLLKKYLSPEFDRGKIKSEETLTALIFFAARHSRISDSISCCQLFDCKEEEFNEYLTLFDIKKTKNSDKGGKTND